MHISVVVPVCNESHTVATLAQGIATHLDGQDWELLFIDDGSNDGTWEELRAVAASMPRVRAYRFDKNRGKALALRAGFERAQGRIIVTMDGDLEIAQAGDAVTLTLEDEIDISRGDLIVKSSEAPEPVKQIDATVCWLSETPLSPARTYLVRHTTREVKAKLAKIDYRLDVNTLEQEATSGLAMNDIARITLKLAQPIVADRYQTNRGTGAFIIIDESTNNTVGAGMIG